MFRKVIFRAILLALCISLTSHAATHVNLLWIGNSLTQSMWCNSDGYRMAHDMANIDSNITGKALAGYGIMPGATSLNTQYANSNGFSQLEDPVVGAVYGWWVDTFVAKYDYMILQTFARSANALAAESTALDKYCQKALDYGTKPVIFFCWDNPSFYTAQARAFLAIYNRYKSQGALLAPLFDIHTAIIADKGTAYLYGTDTYLHVNANGAYCSIAVWEYLFTGVKPSAFNLANKPCGSSFTEKAYLDGKIEAVLSNYYNLNGTEVRKSVRPAMPGIRVSENRSGLFDVAGKRIGKGSGQSSTTSSGMTRRGIAIVSGKAVIAK